MMNTDEFKCVFCKESFGDKETLQEHFRKHGDKNFHLRKSRSQDEPALPDKPASNKDQVEMVECDVCPDVFTSISKAITHKHKVHPDHDAKYFCPWCGKLFTMKHLYNKHIQSTHPNNEKIDKSFHCDVCNVDFNLPAAMSYHNKFFHRIFEMPTIGNSKKLKMFSQEVVPIYYCPFCGEEYDNKINLHKHITDDHSDENQHPDDVLRCPVCEAVFYHLDAYELHLTYHSVDDMYSERSAIMDEITDFSLETVPPIEEKVESLEPQSEGGAMGIEQLFELTMDDAKHKKKKHKKHKKSKKSAITLDQFLNMNTDVFGEGLDFQGVEEVASQTIAKRLKKPMKKPAQTILPPNIEKLKRQGIVIKKKPGAIAVKPVMVNPTRVDKTAIPVIQTKPNALAPNDVLSKLINQNNSQIKIVKKSSLEIKSAKEDTVKEEMQQAVTADDKVSVENVAEPNEANTTMSISNDNDDITNNIKTDDLEANNDAYPNNTTRRSPILEKSPKCLVDNDDEESNHSQSILKANETDDDQTDAETNDVEKLAALRINSNIVIKSNQQTVSEVNKNKEVPLHEADENVSNHDDTDVEDTEQGINGETNKNDSLNALKHLSHLIVKPCNQENKSTSKQDNHVIDKKVEQTDVSKIAHLIRNNPSNITNTPKNTNSTQFNTLLKIKTAESKESKFESEDESYENDNGTTEPMQSEKLASILNSPHLNVQTIKKSHKLVPQKESPVESLPKNEKSSTDLLKHLKNVTAKPVNVNKTVNLPTSSPKLSPKLISTIKKEPATPPVKHSKVIQEDIEIFNIDDSDSDEAITNTAQHNKTENKEIPAQNKSADVLKNINKNITIKSLNNHNVPNKVNDQLQMKEFYSDDGVSEDESHGRPLPHNSRNPKFSSPQIDHKKSALNNVLKNLGRNITVKTGNSSPGHFSMSDHKSQDSNFAQEDDSVDSEDSLSSRVKITEMKDASDEESHKELTDTNDQVHDNVKVQYPNDSNSDNEEKNYGEFDENFSDEDIETHLPTNTVKNYPISKPLESFKNVCKDLVIKPSGQTNRTQQLPSDEIPPFAKSLSNRISIKNMKQADNCNKQVKANTGHPMNKSAMSQKMASSSNQSNTVNKEVKTVKTFQTQTQTQTVIQEITTTVTKTIKTVNQSMKQEIRNAGQSSSMPHKIQQLNANNRNLQGIKVRHTAPMAAAGPRVRNPGMRPARPVLAAPIRPSNQLVPIRPRPNVPRLTNSRMPNVRPSTSGQLRPQIGAPVKLAPGVVNSKRPNTEAPGHFSCFKKTKESLFPEADFSAMKHEGESSSVQFSSTTQMSKSNFASTTKTLKGNSVVTATQMKSEMSASSQQLGKLRNLSGLSVVKTSQANESHVEERSEISAAKQNTLDAIQKLQSQGLLVKKPRLVSAESEHSNPGSDEMEHFTDDEFGT